MNTVLSGTAKKVDMTKAFKFTEVGEILGFYFLTMQHQPNSMCTVENAWSWFARLVKCFSSQRWPSWLPEILYVFLDVAIMKLTAHIDKNKIKAMMLHIEERIKRLNAPEDKDLRDRIMNRIQELRREIR